MDKEQAIHQFWSSFGIPAYDENTVPDSAVMPYITYSVSTGSLDDFMSLYASLWYRDTSWEDIVKKKEQIARYVGEEGFVCIPVDGGYLYISPGRPFSQRMSDPSDNMVRRMYINLDAEFLTAY